MDLELLLQVFGKEGLRGLDPSSAFENVHLIHEMFEQHIDPNKVGEHMEQVLSDEHGLNGFVRDKLAIKEFNQSKEEVFRLFEFVLAKGQSDKRWKTLVAPFCLKIAGVAKMYARSTRETAKLQQLGLECLIAVYEVYEDHVDEDSFELPNLYWELLPASEKSVFQPSVRGKMFHVLGLLASLMRAKLFASDKHFKQLFGHVVRAIQMQVESKDAKLEVAILQGCMKAMDRLINGFREKIDRSSREWKQFYKNLVQVVDPQCSIAKDSQRTYQLKRREFQRAALEVVANNVDFMKEELFQTYRQWYTDALSWARSINASDSSIGRRVLFSFLQAVFDYGIAMANTINRAEVDEFAKFFIGTFKETLSSETPRRNDLIAAVQGIGLLAPLSAGSQEFSTVSERIFENVGKIALELNNPVTDKYGGSLTLLSTYIETIASLLRYCQQEEDYTKSLKRLNLVEQVAVHLLTRYPQLSEYQKRTAHHCFLKLVKSLHEKHNMHCVPLLDRTLRVVLAQIMSSPTAAELEILNEALKTTAEEEQQTETAGSVTPKTGTLGLKGIAAYTRVWVNMVNADTEPLTSKLIYDRILTWIVTVLERLNLSINTVDFDDEKGSEVCADVFSMMQPERPKDFQIFQNVVDFFVSFLRRTEPTLFRSWASEFVLKLIDGALKNPLVSGFYKMLGAALECSSKLNLFQMPEYKVIRNRCGMFMKAILTKMETFRDDLLVSVLELYLSAPDVILVANLGSWCATLEKIFKMGTIYLPLADKSCDALQRWMKLDTVPREALEEIVGRLFPVWRSYFLSEGTLASIKKAVGTVNRHAKDSEEFQVTSEDTDVLYNVQLKLLKIIGSFAHVLDLEEVTTSDYLDTENNVLKVTIPLVDHASDIYIDPVIPKALSICEGSANRQLRTAACELLHTSFLYLLGDCARRSASENQPIGLFTKMFRTIMKLSGDLDFLVRQMFNPLASQCIHWFTQNRNKYSEIILQILVDGLVSDDAQLRDFSADCFHEFFKYSLKQSQRILGEDAVRFILALSTHSNDRFRLGASLAFNSIYRDFREDPDLLNRYAIVLLTGFVTSVGVSGTTDEESIVIKANKASLAHLEKMITSKHFHFNANIGKRKRPLGFKTLSVCLGDLVEWLMNELCRPGLLFRRECFRLISVIVPLTRVGATLPGFLKTWSTDVNKIVQVAEYCLNVTVPKSLSDQLLDANAALEFYEFLNQHGALPAGIIHHSTSKLEHVIGAIMKTSITETQPDDFRIIGAVCAGIEKMYENSSTYPKPEFRQFMYNVSKSLDSKNDIRILLEILEKADLNLELSNDIKEEASFYNISKAMGSSGDIRFKKLRWIRLAAEAKLLSKVLDTPGSDNLCFQLWNALLATLYKSQEGGFELEGNIEVFELQDILRTCFALKINQDVVCEAAFNPELLSPEVQATDPSCSTKGEKFQKTFANVLLRPQLIDFEKMAASVKIEKIGCYMETLLLVATSNQDLKMEYGVDLYESVTKMWTPISVNCDPFTVARILSGLVALNIEKCQTSIELCRWWCGPEVMGNVNTQLSEKSEFLGFMSLFLLSSDATISQCAREALQKMTSINFPKDITSTDNKDCVAKLIGYILGTLERNRKDEMILKLLCHCLSRISDLIGDGAEMNYVFNDVAHRLVALYRPRNGDNDMNISGAILTAITNAETHYQSYRLFRHCLIPVLRTLRPIQLRNFFKSNIGFIMGCLEVPVNELRLSAQQLHLQALVYNILAMIAQRMGPSYLLELSTEYTKVQEAKGISSAARKSIIKVVSSAFVQVKQRNVSQMGPEVEQLREALLKCHAAAYHALAVLLTVSEIPNQKTIIEQFLLHESRVDEKLLWENLIDCTVNIQQYFPVVLEAEDGKNKLVDEDLDVPNTLSRATQIAKQRINVTQSSLIRDVAFTFDFTGTATVTDSSFYQRILGTRRGEEDGGERDNRFGSVKLSFVSQAFSSECLEGLVCVIRKLVALESPSNISPKWCTYLTNVLESNHHGNIKSFILYAILNCHDILKFMANSLISPVCKVMTDNSCGWEEPFNHFTKDLLVMLLEWNDVAVPPDTLKSTFLEYLVDNTVDQNSKYSRNDVLDNNLNLLETMVRLWKIRTDEVPSQKIAALLALEDDASKRKVANMICNRLLKAEVVPSRNPSELIQHFCRILKVSLKPLYSTASENLGLLLKLLGKENYSDLLKVSEYVCKKLRAEKERQMPFLSMLWDIQKNWPNIVGPFKEELLRLLGSSSSIDVLRVLYADLSAELKHSTTPDETVFAFVSNVSGRKVFDGSCSSEDAEFGISLLETVAKYSRRVPDKVLFHVARWLKVASDEMDNHDLQVRYYGAVSDIYFSSQLELEDRTELLDCFINGLKVNNAQVREKVETFWFKLLNEHRRPQDLILQLLLMIGSRADALEIILSRLLQRCSLSKEFGHMLFDRPLQDCVFHNYKLDTSWKGRQATFLPLFAESISTQQFSTIPEQLQASVLRTRISTTQFGVNLLRATLSLQQRQFSLTQMDINESEATRRNTSIVEPMEVDVDEGTFEGKTGSAASPLSHLRKRFYNRPNQTEYFAARQTWRTMERREAVIEKLKEKRGIKVSRSYRIGEVPDIMVKRSDFLTTLFKLGELDSDIGRIVLAEVMSSTMTDLHSLPQVFEKLLSTSASPGLASVIIDVSIRKGLQLQPKPVAGICTRHDMYELGIILLEKQLVHSEVSQDLPASKKGRFEAPLVFQDGDETTLLLLAKIYQDFEEVDVLKGLFKQLSERKDVPADVLTVSSALSSESSGKWEETKELYNDVFDRIHGQAMDIEDSFTGFIEKAFFNCLAKMSEWEQLRNLASGLTCTGGTDFFNYQRAITRSSAFAQGCLMVEFQNHVHTNAEEILQLIGDWSDSFLVEKACLLLCCETNNFQKVSLLLDKFWKSGITALTSFSHLSLPRRKEQVLKYQLASTAEDIMSWMRSATSETTQSLTNELCCGMRKLFGNPSAPLFNSGFVVSARTSFMKKLLERGMLEDDMELCEKLYSLNFQQNLWVLSLALRDENMCVANTFLQKSKELGKKVQALEFVQWRKLYVYFLSGVLDNTDREDWLQMWVSAWKKLGTGSTASQDATPQELLQIQGRLLTSFLRTIVVGNLASTTCKNVNKVFGLSTSSTVEDAVSEGCLKFFELLKQPKYRSSLEYYSGKEVLNLLDELTNRYPERYKNDTTVLELTMESLVWSITCDGCDGILLVPRLLTLLQSNHDLHNKFQSLHKKVPVWKILPWIDQVLSACKWDDDVRAVLQPLVNSAVEMHSDAFYHQYVDVLPKSVQNFHAQYVQGLQALVLPTVLHKDVLEQLTSSMGSKDLSKVREAVVNLTVALQHTVDNPGTFGVVHTLFAQEMLGLLKHHKDHLNDGLNLVDFQRSFESVKASQERKVFPDGSLNVTVKNLKEFSPWLSKFHQSQTGHRIKLPGSFDAMTKPQDDTIPEIVSFNATVSVYRSLTYPVRLTVLGNDGKSYSFLVKYGDDLRQDRRIQQLFRVSNEIFVMNSSTMQRKINISAYSVVALSQSFGLIAWIDKSVSLSSFLINSKKLEDQQHKSMNQHRNWLQRLSGLQFASHPVGDIYATASQACSRDSAERQFDQLSATISKSLLVDRLLERSRSYEHFFHVRQNFIRSYAAMSLAHWLIGIGDRHLQNSLVSLESGRVIGIDFGRAFEIGNIGFPVPELIPFRLTPNFLHLMVPYGSNGLFKETMVIVWKALVGWSDVIVFIVDALVNEREITWTKARKTDKELETSSTANQDLALQQWSPLQVVQEKLRSTNPTATLIRILEWNKWEKIVPIYTKIVRDGRDALLSADSLQTEQLIDCLIDLATDKNILARLYTGLQSWI